MKRLSLVMAIMGLVVFTAINLSSCSKSSPDPAPPPPPTDPCAGKTIAIALTPTASAGCPNSGSITASATGSTSFTYKLNAGGTYQASGTFSNVAPGTYSVFAKDGAGCEKSKDVTVAGGVKGPLFTQVRDLITVRCQSCHNTTVQNGGQNWVPDCNIVAGQDRIKIRAVDRETMPAGGPPLTTAEKATITNWINAGGRFTD